MINYPKILFPVDLSDTAPIVAKHVVTLARKFDSEVHAVYVVPSYEGPTFPSYAEVMEEIRARAGKDLRAFVMDHLQGLERAALTQVMVGHASRGLLNYVENNDISLVVMGTHGRSGMGRLFFGSVAQRVVQSCPVPVMTIHPVEPEE